MSIQDIRSKSIPDLLAQVAELRREALNLRFRKATHELSQTARIKTVRRSIARLLTVIREKELATGGNNA